MRLRLLTWLLVLLMGWLLPLEPAGARTMPARGEPPPCAASALHATAVWQQIMWTMAGTLTLRNRGPSGCALRGYPRVVIHAREGVIVTGEIRSPDGPAGFPVGSTELVPDQASQVYVQWEGYCRRVDGPFHLIITLPAGGKVTAPVSGWQRYGGTDYPGCGDPRVRSFLHVSSFQPAFDPGVVNLLGYYGFINRHDYADAYAATRDAGVTRDQFAAGYRQTAHVGVTGIAVPVYRVRQGDAAYACIGIALAARQLDGTLRLYGGWMLSEVRAGKIVSVVIAGSHMVRGGVLVVPSKKICAAAVLRLPDAIPRRVRLI